uniref:Uncharacterized protein n=1 Tax=Panagrolaimus sp. ES5 TaxID=591445 RepID=A0AC34G555_9BILA
LVPGNHSEVTTLEIIKEKVPKEQVIRRQKLSGSQYRKNKNHPALRSVKSATLTVNHNDTAETITPDEDKKFQKSRRRSSKFIQKEENIQEYNQINVTDENGHITSTIEYANEEEPEQPIPGFFRRMMQWFTRPATVYGFCKGECIPSLLYNLSYYMCYLNSSGNPFAYALANRQFRSAFGRILRGNFHRVT